MKQDWQIKKLGEVCDFQNGFAFKSKTYKENGLPILRITNIQNDRIDIKDLVYFDKRDYKINLDKFRIFKGDLLIAMSGGTTGKLGISDSESVFYLNQRVGKFIPKKDLNKKFLYYFLTTKVEESLKIAAGSAQPNLSTDQINSFVIPLPPLSEQKKIVEVLDQAFAGIEQSRQNTKQNLKNAKEIFESYLQGVFENKGEDWEEKKLGEVCEFINGLWKGKKEPFQKVGVIRNTNFSKDYKLDYSNVVYLDVESNQFAKRKLKYGDIILEKSGGGPKQPVGRVVVFDKITGDYSFSNFTSAIRIKDDSEIDFNYLYKYLMLKYISGETEKMQSHSTGIRNLKFDDYKEIPIPLPPLSEQQTIVRQLDALRAETQKLEAIYTQKLNSLDELKKSLLQKAFAGKLVK